MSKIGTPRKVITDNGKEFLNSGTRRFAEEKGIDWRYGAPYSPTTTGLVERFNRTFIEKLKKITEFGRWDWGEMINKCLVSYMNSYHRALGCTPQEVIDGKTVDPRQQEAYKKSYEQRNGENIRELGPQVGDKVLYHHPIGKGNKLRADYDVSGVVIERSLGSATLRLGDGRVIRAALRNLKRLN
ncbi:Pol polyprotein [Nosema granulosis]|uniref:Pol polyprotein n=1 Tax=Nosema granulosis TaxID=83296 RepID=A0A9P6KYU5_9MICR|nr:Pol polyprotein [Nosema granulosis]